MTLKDLELNDQQVPDERVLEVAIELNRTLITFNRKDFIKLHRKSEEHFGIIVATLDASFQALVERIEPRCKQEMS